MKRTTWYLEPSLEHTGEDDDLLENLEVFFWGGKLPESSAVQ